jgi:hypothetical protein
MTRPQSQGHIQRRGQLVRRNYVERIAEGSLSLAQGRGSRHRAFAISCSYRLTALAVAYRRRFAHYELVIRVCQ